MYTIRQIPFSEIRNTAYEFSEKHDTYEISFKGEVVAYTQFKINDNRMYLYFIEVIFKRAKHGTNSIKWLINYYQLSEISGFCLLEERSMIFWKSLGAELYFVDIEGYTIQELLEDKLETPFKLIAQ